MFASVLELIQTYWVFLVLAFIIGIGVGWFGGARR